MVGGRRTLKKDIASRRRSHKRQAGGAAACGTTTKSNYTIYFAGSTFPGPGPAVPSPLPIGTPSTGYPTGTYAAASGGSYSTKALAPLGTFGPRFNANVGTTGSMIFDAAGMMYCATNYGIVKIDPTGTITSFVTPAQLITPMATTSYYINIAFGKNNTIVAGSTTTEAIKVITLPAGTVTTPKPAILEAMTGMISDSAGNIYYTPGGTTTLIKKIDATTYATTTFAGTGGTINVAFGASNYGCTLAYHPTENSIYYFDMRNKKLHKLSLTSLTAITITTGPEMFYAMALDPIRNIMYFGGPNWSSGADNLNWTGVLASLNLSPLGSVQRYSGLPTITGSNSLIGGTSSNAGSSTVCTGDTTNASFTSTVLYPSYIWYMSVDADGNVYVSGEFSGLTSLGTASHIYLISPTPPAQDPSSSSQTTVTLTSITITWSDDTSATSYTFTVSPAIPTSGIPVITGAATTATFTGMASSTQYTIKIIAANKLGTAPATGAGATVYGTTALDGTGFALNPPVPTSINLIGSTPSVTAVYLSWMGLPSLPYAMYTITPTAPSGPVIQGTIPQTAGTSITQSPYIVRGLAPETTYSVTITGSMQSTFPTGVYTATTAPISFTTPPLLPVFLGTLVGGLSNALGTSLTSNAGTALDGAGNMYIASGTCIYKVSPSTSTTNWLFDTKQTFPTPTVIPYSPSKLPIGVGGSTVSLFAGTTTGGAPSTTPQTGPAIRFGQIRGITYNSTQNALYVADSLYSVIVKVTISPVTATIVAGQTSTAGKVDGAFGVNTLTATTNGMISTVANQLYITDYTNSIVRTLNTTVTPHTMGTVQSAASTPTAASSASSIVQLPNGSFLVASAGTHTLQLLRMTSSSPVYYAASVYAGTGTAGNADGPLLSASFNTPTSLAIDAASNIYVYDSGNYSIRVIVGTMVYTYLGGTLGNLDGPAVSARLKGGSGLMVDSNGFLYISDTTNNSLRVVAPYPANQVISDSQLIGYRASAAQASSALVQTASSAVAQTASSAVAQAISGAQQSSAVAQQDSSAQAQAVSGAQQSSAVAQQASTAVASSALAQSISGAQASSATAQVASSAVAQAISGAQQSSAVAQQASTAVASSALAQSISGAQASSATAQRASSALAQSISGAQQSSAVAQQASTAVASSALAESISGAQASSAVAQQASSALAQSISGAEASSAVAQQASSAVAQQVSSAVAQSISGAQQSSAVAQQASSAVAQNVSSAVAQNASSAQQLQQLSGPLSVKNDIIQAMQATQAQLNAEVAIIYSPRSSPLDIATAKQSMTDAMSDLYNEFGALADITSTIFSIAPMYQDRVLQPYVYEPYVESLGYIKLYDSMRKTHIIIDSNGYIVQGIDRVANRPLLPLPPPELPSVSPPILPTLVASSPGYSEPSSAVPLVSSGPVRYTESSSAVPLVSSGPVGYSESSSAVPLASSGPVGYSESSSAVITPSLVMAPSSATTAPSSATTAPSSATTAPSSATTAPSSATTAPSSATTAPSSATTAPSSATTAPSSAVTLGPSAPVTVSSPSGGR